MEIAKEWLRSEATMGTVNWEKHGILISQKIYQPQILVENYQMEG